MKRNVTWILVADAAKARIFETPGGDDWKLVGEFQHLASREQNQDLMPNRGPRIQHTGEGAEYQNALEPGSLWATEAKRFAQELNDVLKRAVTGQQFSDLVIIAAPKFLGHLRRELDKPVAALVRQEIAKDLVNHNAEDIVPIATGV